MCDSQSFVLDNRSHNNDHFWWLNEELNYFLSLKISQYSQENTYLGVSFY